MPSFWQFPTGSMGLGSITAIYQARFLRYLENRGLLDTKGRKVWEFVGDGEMDEPESLAGLSLAAREGLDNLIFVVNCNLQRLDGPVRGNGSIIQELEGLFAGAGWNVIKVLWGSDWDPLFARDHENIILRRLHETVDGEFQKYAATDGRFNREHFFNKYPELQKLVAHLSDEDIDRLKRGGHDPVKIYAAYHAAVNHKGQPTVILAQTKKGYGMGHWGQGRMTAHQQKKLEDEALLAFRDRFALPLSDEDVRNLRLFKPADDSPEMKYLHQRRQALGGYLPARAAKGEALPAPSLESMAKYLEGTQGREQSTTMIFVQLLSQWLQGSQHRQAHRAHRRRRGAHLRHAGAVPASGDLLVGRPDLRAGGQGRAALLQGGQGRPDPRGRHHRGRRHLVVDRGGHQLQRARRADAAVLHLLLLLRLPAHRRPDLGRGRLARARLPARRHRRPHHALRRRPAARGRLQPSAVLHRAQLRGLRSLLRLRADGDPAGRHAPHAGESGGRVLLRDGDERELRSRADAGGRARGHPERNVPAARVTSHSVSQSPVQLLGSGTILREVLAAAELLEQDWNVSADVWSVTSFTELRREGMDGGSLEPPAPRRRAAAHPRRAVPGADAGPRDRRHATTCARSAT